MAPDRLQSPTPRARRHDSTQSANDIRAATPQGKRAESDPMVAPLARGLAILCAFGRGRAWLGNLDIAQETGIPAPTVSRLLHSLLVLGYVQQDETTRLYALAPAALALGYAAVAAPPQRSPDAPQE
ncbi:helix-turn-helix domain-containing protein [Burkholderia sp. Ax-1719]|jgi:hypothetical protein|nr:helix-turn-helix domain-containing protein [Burkholderia sp. Ax-1719]